MLSKFLPSLLVFGALIASGCGAGGSTDRGS